MEFRDNYKSKDYFLGELERINKNIDSSVSDFNNGKVVGVSSYYVTLNRLLLDKISIMYVLGYSYDTIRELVRDYCLNVKEYSKESSLGYTCIVNVLSLGYLFDIDKDDLMFIKSNMVKEKYVDAVLDLLRNKVFDDKMLNTKDFYFMNKGFFGDEYVSSKDYLLDAINSLDVKDREKYFVDFLDVKYKKYYNKLINHYDEIGEDRYVYVGSYSFKFTAVAKILGLDKNLFSSSSFIASDLL